MCPMQIWLSMHHTATWIWTGRNWRLRLTRLSSGLHYTLERVTFAVQSNYIAGLIVALPGQTDDGSLLKENYFLLNASVKYRPVSFLELFLSAKNITNTGYEIDYGYPMPGYQSPCRGRGEVLN